MILETTEGRKPRFNSNQCAAESEPGDPMTTIELTQHPELAALVAVIRQGETVDILDHGRPVAHCVPPPVALRDRLTELHQSFTSPPYPGNSVVDMRRESR